MNCLSLKYSSRSCISSKKNAVGGLYALEKIDIEDLDALLVHYAVVVYSEICDR